MGSFDGAEICELIGLYILSLLQPIIKKGDIGLYRDDGLMILHKTNPQKTDKIRKQIIKVFKDIGFQIEIEINLPIANFLDITLNLTNETYQPYKKPNNNLSYIHTSSNHPPQIIKQLPNSINDRLTANSSNNEIFTAAKYDYEEALKKSGYKSVNLKYQPDQNEKPKRNRKRKIIYFNPPFSKNVSTNVAKIFLKLVDKHFPSNNKLHKIFNRNTVKVSYSCTNNIGQIIKSQNNKLTAQPVEPDLPCNCPSIPECPLDGKCRATNVIYKCTASAPEHPNKIYLGLSQPPWKFRYSNHKSSFNLRRNRNKTTLSKYVWFMREIHKVEVNLTWSIVKRVPAYSNITKKCPLCLHEKLQIITYPNQAELLNKRSELISTCRHENRFLLKNCQ